MKKSSTIIFALIILIFTSALLGFVWSKFFYEKDKILDGVYIGNAYVGGQTRDEAIKKVANSEIIYDLLPDISPDILGGKYEEIKDKIICDEQTRYEVFKRILDNSYIDGDSYVGVWLSIVTMTI